MSRIPQSQRSALAQQVTGLASSRAIHTAFDWFHLHERELLQWQIELLQVPAPPFGEAARSEWLRSRFAALKLSQVHIDEIGNVIGTLRGSDPSASAVLVSAHIDTVFPAGTQYEIKHDAAAYSTRIEAPGASDNGTGVTALLAIAAVLAHAKVKHRCDIILVGNVGEEGEGDLRGMRHLFASKLRDRIACTLVLDGTGHDGIVTQALGSRRFDVTVHGEGGHSWHDYGRPNPINVLARAISLFQDVPVPSRPRSSASIGMISGGTSVNTIPQSASMRVDIRSVGSEEIDRLEEALRKSVHLAVTEVLHRGSASRDALSVEISKIGDRPAGELHPDARILSAVQAVDAHLDIRSELRRSSTDANIPLSLGLEAVTIGAGGSGGGAHTLSEWYDAAGRTLALQRILLTALALAE